jgi:asparagine synthase (glutamine-hydrolysing)
MRRTCRNAIAAMSEPMVSYDNIGFYLLSREVSKTIKVVQSGQGADEVFGGYHWYPPLADSRTTRSRLRRAFFDRDHAGWPASGARLAGRPRRELARVRRGAFRPPRRRRPGGQGAAARHQRHAGRRSGEAGRQHDHGLGAGGAGAVPRPRAGRTGRPHPGAHKLAHGGKGVLKEAARKVIPHEVIDRPKGYFPVPALKYVDGPYLEMCRDALTSRRRASAGCSAGLSRRAVRRSAGACHAAARLGAVAGRAAGAVAAGQGV